MLFSMQIYAMNEDVQLEVSRQNYRSFLPKRRCWHTHKKNKLLIQMDEQKRCKGPLCQSMSWTCLYLDVDFFRLRLKNIPILEETDRVNLHKKKNK